MYRNSMRVAMLVSLLGASLFVVGIFVAPILDETATPGAELARAPYTPLCHQMEERSLTFVDHPLAVCARCTGLYVGGLAGLFLALCFAGVRAARPGPLWLLALSLPSLVDVLLPWLGWAGAPNWPRMWMAVPPGILAGIYLAIGIHDLVDRGTSRRARSVTRAQSVLEGFDG
jgi:uncharacterized membrane protein